MPDQEKTAIEFIREELRDIKSSIHRLEDNVTTAVVELRNKHECDMRDVRSDAASTKAKINGLLEFKSSRVKFELIVIAALVPVLMGVGYNVVTTVLDAQKAAQNKEIGHGGTVDHVYNDVR